MIPLVMANETEFVVVRAVGVDGSSHRHEVQLSLRSLLCFLQAGLLIHILDLGSIPKTFNPLKRDVDEIGDRTGRYRSRRRTEIG